MIQECPLRCGIMNQYFAMRRSNMVIVFIEFINWQLFNPQIPKSNLQLHIVYNLYSIRMQQNTIGLWTRGPNCSIFLMVAFCKAKQSIFYYGLEPILCNLYISPHQKSKNLANVSFIIFTHWERYSKGMQWFKTSRII